MKRPGQQAGGPGPDVVVAGEQVRGQSLPGLGPGRQVRTAGPLPAIVVGHPRLLPAVDLHVGGVHVDRDRAGDQRLAAPSRKQPEPAGQHLRVARLDSRQLIRAEPVRQAGRGRGRDRWHRRQQPGRTVSALPVKIGPVLAPEQLTLRHCDQQLTGAHPTSSCLDRPDPAVERRDHTQPANQFAQRRHPRRAGQRPVRHTEPHTRPALHLPLPLLPPYLLHPEGAFPCGPARVSTTLIVPAGQALSSSHTPDSRHYSRIRVRSGIRLS